MRHWTDIAHMGGGEFSIECECGWDGYADSYEDALEIAIDHREG